MFADFTGPVSLSSSLGTVRPDQAILSNGQATLEVTLDTPGTATLIASNSSGASGTSNSFQVLENGDRFVFDPIGKQTAGEPFLVTIKAVTATGALFTGFNDTVSLSSTLGTVTPNQVTLENGLATVVLTLDTPGSVRLMAVSGTMTGTSNSFEVVEPSDAWLHLMILPAISTHAPGR
jgi:hypothetical protein